MAKLLVSDFILLGQSLELVSQSTSQSGDRDKSMSKKASRTLKPLSQSICNGVSY